MRSLRISLFGAPGVGEARAVREALSCGGLRGPSRSGSVARKMRFPDPHPRADLGAPPRLERSSRPGSWPEQPSPAQPVRLRDLSGPGAGSDRIGTRPTFAQLLLAALLLALLLQTSFGQA